MPTAPTPRKPSTRSTKRARPRKRTPAKAVTATSDESDSHGPQQQLGRRGPSGQAEQLIVVVGALGFGLGGLALHFLWIVSILLMALQLGLIGSDVRNRHGRGIVAEIVNEAKVVVQDVKKPGEIENDDDTPGTSSAS